MSVRIILDSSADVANSLKDKCIIVPLTIRFGETEFQDGITMDHKEFYEKLIESDVLPTTSQASPNAFDQVYKEIINAGDEAVVLTVSSKLSGTFQSAMISAEDYAGNIQVVDSHSVSIGTGILAEVALRLAEEGRTAAEIASILEEQRNKVRIVALLDTLEYLKKGGRISSAVAFAGGLLSIKPVVSLHGGEIKLIGKARGSKQGNNQLVRQIEECGGVDFTQPVLLGYTGLTDVYLNKYIEDSRFLWEGNLPEIRTTVVGSVVGTHAGPGAVAVAFFQNA